ncbi:MAG: twin-arginine translocation pathway signal protein [Rubrivivax sp.]|nr:twin-arginine translocation pathway signal protein [Rubrivivax sp.]
MTFNRRHAMAACAGAVLLPLGARAQAIDQLKVYYGFPPGSAGDITARRVTERLQAAGYVKTPGVVENKIGAGGRIALETLKTAPADGTVLAVTPMSPVSIYPHVFKKLAYDPPVDFVPVSMATIGHHALAIGPSVPENVKTLKDFLAWAKATPEKAAYGSPGAGSTLHLLGAWLGLLAGVPLNHVPYRGSAPGVTDTVGGQIACMITPLGDVLPHQKTGKLRVLASTGPQRSPFSPDVPTFAEQGFADLTTEEWFSFFAPAKTPPAVLAAANAAINAALKEKAVIDTLATVSLIARGSTAEELGRSQRAEFERWGPVIRRIGFTAES